MPDLRTILVAGVIPGVVSGVALLLLWWWDRWRQRRVSGASDASPGERSRARERVGPVWLLPVLLAGSFIAGDYTVNGTPFWWPDSNPYRFVHAAAALGLLGLVEGVFRLAWWVAAVLRAGVLGGIVWMLGEGYVPHAVAEHDFVGWMLLAGLGGAGLIAGIERGARELRGAVPMVPIVMTFGAAPGLMFFAGYAGLAQAAIGPIACATAAMVVGLLFRDRLRVDRGTVTVACGLLVAMAVGAGFQVEPLSGPALLLFVAGPVGIAAAAGFAGRHWGLRLAAATIASAALLGASAYTLHLAQPEPAPEEEDPYADYYQYYDE